MLSAHDYFAYMYVHSCMCTICVHCLQKPGEGTRFIEAEVIDSCEPPYMCWLLNAWPLLEQVALTTELSFHPQANTICNIENLTATQQQ